MAGIVVHFTNLTVANFPGKEGKLEELFPLISKQAITKASRSEWCKAWSAVAALAHYPAEPHWFLNCWTCWQHVAHSQVFLQKSCPQLNRNASFKVMLLPGQPAGCYKGIKSQSPCLKPAQFWRDTPALKFSVKVGRTLVEIALHFNFTLCLILLPSPLTCVVPSKSFAQKSWSLFFSEHSQRHLSCWETW